MGEARTATRSIRGDVDDSGEAHHSFHIAVFPLPARTPTRELQQWILPSFETKNG
jgi:hypothetical protein